MTSNPVTDDAQDPESFPLMTSTQPVNAGSISWAGRLLNAFGGPRTIVKKATAIAAAVGAIASGYFGIYHFSNIGYSLTASLGTGAGIGLFAPIAISLGLPSPYGKRVLDFIAKWSFSTMQCATGFALNAGVPLSTLPALWNVMRPPPSAIYGSNMFFGALATSYLMLHLRSIVLKKAEYEPKPLAPEEKNRLFLEGTTAQPIRFALEQLLKIGIGGSLLVLEHLSVLTAQEWRFLGYFLLGSCAAGVASYGFYRIKDSIERHYPIQPDGLFGVTIPYQTRIVRIADKALFFLAAPLTGILFTSKDPYAYIGFGAMYTIQKLAHLRRFENLTQNPQSIPEIQWPRCGKENPPPSRDIVCRRIQTVTQGILAASGFTWFIIGMTDPINTFWDRLYISSMLVSVLSSYPATRALIDRWDPQKRSAVLNTLRFYVVDNPSLYLPYLFRRFDGTLGGTVQPSSFINGLEDIIAWSSFGAAWGSHTAYNGTLPTTEHSSPTEISPIAIIACAVILARRGTLGGVK